MFKFTMARSKYSTTVYLPTQCLHVYVYHANPEDPFYAYMGPIPDDPEDNEEEIEQGLNELLMDLNENSVKN